MTSEWKHSLLSWSIWSRNYLQWVNYFPPCKNACLSKCSIFLCIFPAISPAGTFPRKEPAGLTWCLAEESGQFDWFTRLGFWKVNKVSEKRPWGIMNRRGRGSKLFQKLQIALEGHSQSDHTQISDITPLCQAQLRSIRWLWWSIVGVELTVKSCSSRNDLINFFPLKLEQELKFWNLLPAGILRVEKVRNVKYLSELNRINKCKNLSRLFRSALKVWMLPCHVWYRTQDMEEKVIISSGQGFLIWEPVFSCWIYCMRILVPFSISFLHFPSFPNSKIIITCSILVLRSEDGCVMCLH